MQLLLCRLTLLINKIVFCRIQCKSGLFVLSSFFSLEVSQPLIDLKRRQALCLFWVFSNDVTFHASGRPTTFPATWGPMECIPYYMITKWRGFRVRMLILMEVTIF